MLALESGQGAEGTPFAAYRHLAQGDLQRALGMAATDQELAARMLRMVGASDGAGPDLTARMLALPLDQGADDLSLWTTLAVAAREGRATAALREAVLASDSKEDQAIARFFDAVLAGASQADAEAALGDVDMRSRGIAYSTAVVLKGKRCPSEWRESAKRLLFAAERPFFS